MLLSAADRTAGASSFIEFITVLLIFAIVLAIAYGVTRWIGNFQKSQNTGKNIEVIESVRLSPSIVGEIVKVGNRYICVALSKDNATFLCEVEESDIVRPADSPVSIDFGSVFKKMSGAISGKNSPDNGLSGAKESDNGLSVGEGTDDRADSGSES